jgi:hypothetical protein
MAVVQDVKSCISVERLKEFQRTWDALFCAENGESTSGPVDENHSLLKNGESYP